MFPNRLISAFLLALLSACANTPVDTAQKTEARESQSYRFIPDGNDWLPIVGSPPSRGSLGLSEDLAGLLWAQRTRNGMTVKEAWANFDVSVANFQEALGAYIPRSKYPELYSTIFLAMREGIEVAHGIKRKFNRRRPYLDYPEIHPAVPKPHTSSFPSGHATRGALVATLLADLFPERAGQLKRRGREIGYLRVAIGVHFPSDVEAGLRLGSAIGKSIVSSDSWRKIRKNLAAEVKHIGQ